jgi:hypothetical protein
VAGVSHVFIAIACVCVYMCVCICWAIAYFRLLAEAQPGQSHELALAVGEGVLRVDDGSHAGGR